MASTQQSASTTPRATAGRTAERQRRRRGLGLTLAVLLLSLPAPARAVIFYQTGVGFRSPEFFIYHGDAFVPDPIDISQFSFGGALCPAPGTPNYLCGRLVSEAGNNGGRLFLRSAARFKRTNADPMFRETAAYADTRITITALTGYVGTPPGAAFYFGLSGIRSATTTNANVLTQAFAVARLDAGTGGGVQCFGDVDCTPDPAQHVVKVSGWDPSQGFRLSLRADVAAVAPFGTPAGWDAEVVADFADTLELLAIQLLDENDDPIPGVTLTALDQNGDPLVTFPNEPPGVTVTPTPTTTPMPTPTGGLGGGPTPTPCANPPCEDCENCIDDDGDLAVDRADTDCPVANAFGGGYGDVAGKSLDKCAKAIRKAGAKLATTRFQQVRACLEAVAECVQIKPGEGACLATAQIKCAKARKALAPAEAKLGAQIEKACTSAKFSSVDLGEPVGLGFEAEAPSCARRGVVNLATVVDITECIRREHACAVERAVGVAVPRARELLALGGWDPTALACLAGGADGNGAGVASEKRKALRKCDGALQKAAAKLVAARTKAIQACAAGVFTCLQTKPGDGGCTAKAGEKCAKRTSAAAALPAKLAEGIVKACGAAPLEPADLLAPEGLGASTIAGSCSTLGIPILATAADVADCVLRSLACRVDQTLLNQTPRLTELLQAAGVGLP